MRLSRLFSFRVFAGAALALWTLSASRTAFVHAWPFVRDAPSRISRDTLAARKELRAPGFVDAIEDIKRIVPADAVYFLVEPRSQITDCYMVRSYLAPRRANLLGLPGEISATTLKRLEEMDPHPFVVVAWTPGELPALVSTAALRQLVEKR